MTSRPAASAPLSVMALLLGAGLLLSGCSTASRLLDFSGSSAPLSGKREPVLTAATGSDASRLPAADDPLGLPAASANAAWAQPGGTVNNAPQHLALGGSLAKVWVANAGAGSDSYGRIVASPVIDGGRAFVLDTDATVFAVNSQSGAALWNRSVARKGGDPRGAYGGGLAVEAGRVYAATAFGDVVALDAASGNELWRHNVETPMRAAPTVANGQVYVVGVNNEVIALQARDGNEIWRAPGAGEQAAAMASPSVAVEGDIVLAPATTGDVSAYSSASGMQLWTISLTPADPSSALANLNDVAARPVLSNGVAVAISNSGRMVAVNARSGATIWEHDLAGTQTPWVAGGSVFVMTGKDTLTALSLKTGRLRWQKVLPKGSWAGPVLAGGRLLLAGSEGQLISIKPETGEITATLDLGGKFYIAPVVAGATAYLLSDGAKLIALR